MDITTYINEYYFILCPLRISGNGRKLKQVNKEYRLGQIKLFKILNLDRREIKLPEGYRCDHSFG